MEGLDQIIFTAGSPLLDSSTHILISGFLGEEISQVRQIYLPAKQQQQQIFYLDLGHTGLW